MSGLFQPAQGGAWYIRIVGALIVSAILLLALMNVPRRFRKPLIGLVTFLGGLFFALEFFLPTHPMPTPDSPDQVGNFLTPYVVPFGNIAQVIGAWTVGLGVINLMQVHGRRLLKGTSGAFNSAAFFLCMILMMVIGILYRVHPNAINKNLYALLFNGALQSLDATMFSIVAFYIVSAAYRAFRVRSVEATLLLITAVIVMLGQIAVGQWLTHALPKNLHVEIVRDWILTKANAPAVRAVAFGLGIGGLAVALRIWLGLERGSYFEEQG
ncbi:MAG TPA: hypothetical protein VFB21_26305 [Chthonomonadaceae bacterium]|nr:hypothetical protein [Chthonomonadaceae bacterium]